MSSLPPALHALLGSPPAHDATFWPLLAAWLLFPLHAPLTLLVLDAPFGRFAWTSRLNVRGNVAWFLMEIVAPITFILNLPPDPSPRASTLAALYLMHYAHRAIISPLLLAPKRAPIHVIVIACAMVFNVFNATLLARGLGMFPPTEGGRYYAGIALWVLGFVGNVYHDEILHDLRRPAGSHLVSTPATAPEDRHKNGRYAIPRGGLFALVSFPNYLCEWMEWIGFALAAAPALLVSVPPDAFRSVSVPLLGTLDLSRIAAHVPPRLLAPAWAFVLAEITSMLPRAVRGQAWYRREFATYPRDRRVVIPWLL